jgi:hypothetical protein
MPERYFFATADLGERHLALRGGNQEACQGEEAAGDGTTGSGEHAGECPSGVAVSLHNGIVKRLV